MHNHHEDKRVSSTKHRSRRIATWTNMNTICAGFITFERTLSNLAILGTFFDSRTTFHGTIFSITCLHAG